MEVIDCSPRYLFSVTSEIPYELKNQFLRFCETNLAYLITEIQLEQDILNVVQEVYTDYSNIFEDMDDSEMFFFSENLDTNEKDYPLAKRIHSDKRGQSVEVSSWHETCTMLNRI